ncbi:ARM repeat-containing protein [Rhodofomes roseus]|uniref:ARM repeat-containing protein n=1 Tax=Rhodofomes roseus TaxID=34475 RepID=A0ABQ8KKI2_9APHY|nr:ARM repeat-containing protein [Rhodofomes roseus]KAH9837998.1 ARM repeat-containing protein [Rhodofomes roseus]
MATATKSSQKRPATAQAGPKAKREKKSSKHSGSVVALDKGKKRSRPVTKPVLDEAEESGLDDSEADDFEDEFGRNGDEAEGEDAEMDGDLKSAPSKDPNAARESHKAQRALHNERRAAKPHSVLLADAKRAWRLAHQKNIPRAEREKHLTALMDVIRGNVKDIVLKHDASRIVQTVVRYGGEKERNEVAQELKGRYRELAQNKYSKFLVTKLIRFCPAHRASILREFQGHVLRLLLHREASSVLADAFELYTNAYERSILLRDFYGKEASLVGVSVTAGGEEEKERAKKGLKGVLEGLEGERRRRVLNAVKENLVTIFNNPDKGAVSHTIVHRALWEYLSAVVSIEDEAEQEKLRREMFESCQDVLAEMVHTKDGSRSVREFIVHGTAKDRKQIVKAIKPHVQRMCIDDEAQLVLFTALDVIDDTKLTAKSLVSDMTGSASTLYTSPQGRRALIYLVAPRTRRHFTPAQIATLAETDAVRARTSKKDEALRAAEIRKAASDGLLSWLAESGADVAREPGGSLVVCEVMLYAEGDNLPASDNLLKALSAPYPSPDAISPHLISLPHTSRLYKTLLQGGHFNHSAKAIEPAENWSPASFAKRFVELVGQDTTIAMARGEGAFVVAALCEQLAKSEESAKERKAVSGWFTESVRKEITDAKGKGCAVLLEALDKLDS